MKIPNLLKQKRLMTRTEAWVKSGSRARHQVNGLNAPTRPSAEEASHAFLVPIRIHDRWMCHRLGDGHFGGGDPLLEPGPERQPDRRQHRGCAKPGITRCFREPRRECAPEVRRD